MGELCILLSALPFLGALRQVLAANGMVPSSPAITPPPPPTHLMVMLDGRVVGSVASAQAERMVERWVQATARSQGALRGAQPLHRRWTRTGPVFTEEFWHALLLYMPRLRTIKAGVLHLHNTLSNRNQPQPPRPGGVNQGGREQEELPPIALDDLELEVPRHLEV